MVLHDIKTRRILAKKRGVIEDPTMGYGGGKEKSSIRQAVEGRKREVRKNLGVQQRFGGTNRKRARGEIIECS